jgi:AraC-like DNA-binding protein
MSDVDASMMRAIPRSGGPLGLLVNYLDLIHKKAALSLPEVRPSVVGHIHDLTALAFGANRSAKEQGLSAVAAAHLATALAHIAESFVEPGLLVETVARRQGISSRYLQQLLEASGKSFTARVNELRLQRVFALLTNEQHGKRRISNIALEAGFSDISHFNRLFRARFGDTPRGVRGSWDAGFGP